jgi:two-component system LytT family response regulator
MNRVLIVEDDVNMRVGLAKMINGIDESIKIYQTGSAVEAFEISKENKIDAFLLDVELEDYSGIELSEKIRNISSYKFTPIVFITGIYDRRVEAYVTSSCCDYILKPFKKSNVVKVFEDIVKYGVKKKEESKPLLIVDKGITYLIKEKEIKYLEYKSRKLQIKTIYENFNFSYCTLSKVSKELSDGFIQCHKSFVINKDYIKTVDLRNNQLLISDETTVIPIGRKYKIQIKEIFNDVY